MNEIAWNFYCETWHQWYLEDFGIVVNFNGGIFAFGELNLFNFHQKFALFFSSGRVIMADFSLEKGFIS